MAPKCKSTPSRNPLHSETSSSDPTPSYIQFRDEKAHKDFSENFSQRGIHLERHIVLSNFANTILLDVIHTRGWESLCEIPVSCPIVIIQEFYSNMHSVNTSVPRFTTFVWGTHIVVTLDVVSEILHVPQVAHPDYPAHQRLRTVSKDELLSLFCETHSLWGVIKTPHARALQKVWGSLTWWWHLFSIHCFTTTPS